MSEELNKLTISELKTYLYSLEDKKKKEKEDEVNKIKAEYKGEKKEEQKKEIIKIKRVIDKQYAPMLKTKDKVLNLLTECADIPKNIEKLKVTRYMVYRGNVEYAENVISKTIKRLEKRYSKIVAIIADKVNIFPICENIDELDFSEYKADEKQLTRAKNKYKEEMTAEERMSLIQKELDIVDKVKMFNSVPIPHEILKESDRDIQLKMKKFNNVRQKRLKILSTMEADYLKLIEPRETEKMIDDAISNVENVEEIFTKREYKNIRNSLLRAKRKIYRKTSDTRNIIKTKENRTGIVSYEVQEARYDRMEKLRLVITEATKKIDANQYLHFEDQLKKLRVSYEKEKQFANIIEKLDDVNNTNANTEVKIYEDRIRNLEQKIANSKEIIKEEQEKIRNAKKELLVLWKIEITSAVSNKKEKLLLSETNQETPEDKLKKGALSKLKKIPNGKHACA